MTQPGGFSVGYVLTAADMNRLPGGIVTVTAGGTNNLGYKELTTATANTAAAGIVDVTGASMTFTGVAGRLYKVSIHGFAESTSSAGVCSFFITDGSNNQKFQQNEEFSNTGYGMVSMEWVFTQTGSGTIKLRMDSLIATTTAFGAIPKQGVFVIEDIGPSS